MSLLVGRYMQVVHLIKKKINLIIIEEKIVLKKDVKKIKECTMEKVNRERKRNDTINP